MGNWVMTRWLDRDKSLTATRYSCTLEQPQRVRTVSQGEKRHTWKEKRMKRLSETTRFCEAKKTKMPNTDVRHPLKYY